jgi:hypothetical protein
VVEGKRKGMAFSCTKSGEPDIKQKWTYNQIVRSSYLQGQDCRYKPEKIAGIVIWMKQIKYTKKCIDPTRMSVKRVRVDVEIHMGLGVGIQSIEFQSCNSFDPKGFLRGISMDWNPSKFLCKSFNPKRPLVLSSKTEKKVHQGKSHQRLRLVHVIFCPTNFLLIIG